MARCVRPLLAVFATALALAACSRYDGAERPAWRDRAEVACLAQHLVEPSQFIQPAKAIDGPSICGLHHPFKVYGLAGGSVTLKSASLLDCSMIPALDAWIKDVVQPQAMARFGEPVVQINTMGTYACRGINNMSGAKLSEHAFANAMDIGGFVLASGRELNVMRGWGGDDPQESAFLRDSHGGACTYFTTVLGPGANVFHYNHIHMDLAQHGNSSRGPRRVCKPVPQATPEAPRRDDLPEPPPIEEEIDMAQSPLPAPALAGGATRRFVASAPTEPSPRPILRPVGSVAVAQPRVLPSAGSMPLALVPADAPGGDMLDVDQAGGGTAVPLPPLPIEPRRASRVPEGDPADWDATSAIRHTAR